MTPDSASCGTRSRSRRRVLTGLGTALGGGLAGCAGRVPGIGPERVDTVATEISDGLRWEYPATEAVASGDSDGIGYAAVTLDRTLPANPAPGLRLTLNSTVGSTALRDRYAGYQADWFQFRVGPPAAYASQHSYEMRVQPPAWPEIRVGYVRDGGRKDLVVRAPNVETDGTILTPVVFDPAEPPLPSRLLCSFTALASQSGLGGRTVRASDTGTLALDRLLDGLE